jgi:ABC-2 type transport system ATP-binding protein
VAGSAGDTVIAPGAPTEPPSAPAPAAGGLAIRIRDLRKHYGELEAVRGIDLDVRSGEIFGLIGPDGAGKTSTFQILAGVMPESSGQVSIFGQTPLEARATVGYLTQTFSLYVDLSVAENVRYIGELRRLSLDEIRERGDRYLEMFDMLQFRDRLAGRLSGGMKQKLALVCALIARPQVLLLDEPTTGVDPVSRREFWDALAELSGTGMTIVVATPYLDEAERCSRLALMHEGRLHDTGTPAEVRQRPRLRRIRVRTGNLEAAEHILEGIDGVRDTQRFGDSLDVMVDDTAGGESIASEALAREGVTFTALKPEAPTLENAFVAVLRSIGGEIVVPAFPFDSTRDPVERGAVAIGAYGMRKSFGSFEAVRDVTVEVRHGEVYGLLGANGAGKTTTIKMLCGLLEPTSGDVELTGERGSLRSGAVRSRIGYMSQKFSLYDDLTIIQNLRFFAGVYGVPRDERERRISWVLEASGLEGREQLMTASLPGGWKQRVAFGASLMHAPSVLFLDEPTSGVDPLARRALWKMINAMADRGVAVLVTTHYLEEAEQCNRLGFMAAGEVVAEGSPTEMKAMMRGRLFEIIVDNARVATLALREALGHDRVSQFGDRVHVQSELPVADATSEIRALLDRARVEVLRIEETTFSLEDVFIDVVHRSRDAAVAEAS